MNKHQMDKCREWVRDNVPCIGHSMPYTSEDFVTQKLYEFVMPYRRNVQSLKKQMRYQKAAYLRLKAESNQ